MLTKDQQQNQSVEEWWPNKPPIYDIEESYLHNAEEGPFFQGEILERRRPDEENWTDFLGYKVASPIGIPAGPLLNSKWIGLAADLGYDILCYKTIRSKEQPGHSVPNMVYVECEEQLIPGQLPDHLTTRETPPLQIDKVTVTNSFGMPSRSHEYLAKDIPKAMKLLHRGQVMIVSIVGTPNGNDFDSFLQDFITVAKQAKEYGAKIIEANFSCPNVTTGEGELHTNPETVRTLTSALTKAIGDIPLIIKVGIFEDLRVMEETLIAAAQGGARAICGINTISMKVVDPIGLPALGVKRLKSGICGHPIRYAALEFTREALQINNRHNLGLKIMSTGGALLPDHLTEFIDAGADVAMTATGMMWDPYLAYRYHQQEREIYA
ncbi:MAG: dihydroorotate dehydrogenase [Chlamydiota bacterium]